MDSNRSERTDGQALESTDDSTRRRFLQATATAGVAAAGVAAGTSGVAAQWWGDDGGGSGGTGGGSGGSGGTDPENATAPTFDLGSGGASRLPNDGESELLVYLHGGGSSDSADSQGGELRERLANAGYDVTVVAGVFADGDVGIGQATGPAGDHLAGLIEDYLDAGGWVHLNGYSLGGILTYQTLNALDSGYTVQTASTIGTGTPDDTFCEGNAYHDGVQTNAELCCVLTSENDTAVSTMSGFETGCDGVFGGGSAPSNVRQIDVTSDVDSHLDYLNSTLVAEELASCFSETSGSGGTSGTSGTGGTSGTSGTSSSDGDSWWGSSGTGSSGTSGIGWW